jgi:hypothetical protein
MCWPTFGCHDDIVDFGLLAVAYDPKLDYKHYIIRRGSEAHLEMQKLIGEKGMDYNPSLHNVEFGWPDTYNILLELACLDYRAQASNYDFDLPPKSRNSPCVYKFLGA